VHSTRASFREAARRAGTVHLAGAYAELAATERDVHAGRMPERPFVLVGQQYLADPQRSVGNIHPVWAYAHVPNGYTGDATAAIIAQIERFAPGFRDRAIGQTVSTTTKFAAHNPNFVGGDIMTGAQDFRQLVFGPRITLSPYHIGVPGMLSARPPRHPAPARTVCAVPTPDKPHLATSALKGKPHNLGPETEATQWPFDQSDVSMRITPRSQARSARRGQAAVDGISPRPRRQASRT
jgi:hypothetical protein